MIDLLSANGEVTISPTLTLSVAAIAAIPGILAGLPSIISMIQNRRDHGKVHQRLDDVERKVESIETSITTIASAVQALHIRQEAHEATDD